MITSICLCAVAFLSTPALVSAVGNDEPAFIVEEVSGYAGDEVTVNINVNNNPGICAAGVTVSYDGNTLELKSVTNGSVLGGNIFGPVSNNPIKLTWSTTENSTANGVLATLTFTVKENADSGKSAITLTYDPDEVYNIDMTNVAFAVENGSDKL